MKLRPSILLLMLLCGLLPAIGLAAVIFHDRGTWPDSWPMELEQYRSQAKSIVVAHGKQESVYEIQFVTSDEFEKAWPHILKVKTPGAPLILTRSPSYYNVSGTTAEAGVRILSPANEGDAVWKELLADRKDGDIPEYVRKGVDWRTRTDIMLVVDGDIVDLNSIPLPPDTPIIDKRFEQPMQHSKTNTNDN